MDSWRLIVAKSDELISAIEDECIASALVRFTANDLVHAASVACHRARVLRDQEDVRAKTFRSQRQSSVDPITLTDTVPHEARISPPGVLPSHHWVSGVHDIS
ncbi:MAG TPA: hypothetical protein VGO75_11555 [Gemmatimonadaceae bacterium]|nr:hypothetical protein [Gemmatimonadaceae bacterium]